MAKSKESLVDSLSDSNVKASVEKILADHWYWFPVRHHSPATAFHLKNVILQRKPKLIFVEGPWEANHLLEVVRDRKTKPPVAIYSSFQDDENLLGYAGILSPEPDIPARWACWFPLVEYSPELIAISTGHKIGADVCFMDLPHFHRLEPYTGDQKIESEPDGFGEKGETGIVESDEVDRLIFGSSFYQALAEAGGYQNWDQGWDSLFEFRQFQDSEEFRRELLTFCAAARISSVESKVESKETLQRERFMFQTIQRETEKRGLAAEDVMIVCGGYHTLLDQKDPVTPPPCPSGTVYSSLVPYSYYRIADISGYGAGNRAPLFYSRHWKSLNGKLPNPEAYYIVSVLQRARKNGEAVSSADAISITGHARLLAALRGRSAAILDDLQDAVITCCCKGNPSQEGAGLQKSIDQINIGTAIGKVPPSAPQLPIVRDFYQQLESVELQKLAKKEKVNKTKLDRRMEVDLKRSTFFHRLLFCKVPFCQPEGSTQSDFESGLIFQEVWQTKWSPEVESKLIDLNLFGDSLESVCINLLKNQVFDSHADASSVSRLLIEAVKMDLPNLIEQIFSTVTIAFQTDDRFSSLADALANFLVLKRLFHSQDVRLERTEELIETVFQRCCFAMPTISTAPDDQHTKIVDGIKTLADFVVKRKCSPSDAKLFETSVKETICETKVPFLQGAMIGLGKEIQMFSSAEVSDEILSYAESSQEQMIHAGSFIHGLISVSRTSLLTGSVDLIEAVNQLIRRSNWECYTIMLPSLRAAMELLHSRHREIIAKKVSEIYGLSEPERLGSLEVPISDGLEIVELDKEVAEIMSQWSFSGE